MLHDLVRFMVAPEREATAYATGFRLMSDMERPLLARSGHPKYLGNVRYWVNSGKATAAAPRV